MKIRVELIFAAVLTLIFSLSNHAFGQQSPEYFDFWKEGKWESEITIYNNDTIPEKDSFVVNKLKDKDAFSEEWKIFIGDGEYVDAFVVRAFDQETNRWKLFYVDDLNAQTWDSSTIDDKIYFIKEFNYQGKRFYSRQAWSFESKGRVRRTIERSNDKQNWSTRYWQVFTHVK